MNAHDKSVDTHYGRSDLGSKIIEALRASGKDADALAPQDLAPVDQFHTGGRDATLALARLAGISSGMKILDVGGGLGGPARTLASEVGCEVTVLDITEEFCRVGEMLTRLTGLSDRVSFRHGSALDIPFPDATFDLVWTQHSSMNIADKDRLYLESHRALRPGGRLALHEIMAGHVSPPHFPVPWARDPSISHLRTPAEIRAIISGLGFSEIEWIDETETALQWFRQRLALAASQGPQPLGLHLLMGEDFRRMFQNQVRNLDEHRIAVIQAVFERT
ncbi:MAG: methyltransferase domain-containing protein [Acidobacteriota bacterium]